MPSPLALESLLALKGSPGLSNFGARPGRPVTGNRNQAAAQYAANSLGDPSLADGSVSQYDLEEAQQGQQGDALRKLIMPIQARGEYDLAEGQQRGQFAVEAAKQSQIGAQQRDERIFNNQTVQQNDRQTFSVEESAKRREDMMNRSLATQKSQGLKARYGATQKALEAAKKKSGGVMGWLGFGGDETNRLQQELTAIDAELQAIGPTEVAPPADGAVPPVAAPVAAPGAVRRFNPVTGRLE